MIELQNVSLGYPNKLIIKDISYQFKPSKIYGLVAPNGAGKSTLLNSILNIISPLEGTIIIDGWNYQSIKQTKAIRQVLCAMPSQSDLIVNLSGLDHLKFYHSLWKKTSLPVKDVVKQLKMESYIKTPVKSYSLGMKQRLCFAMLLTANTPYLLMDEVMNGLDPDNVALISHIIEEKRHSGSCLIIASHLLENLESYADSVLFIHNQQLVEVFDQSTTRTLVIKAGVKIHQWLANKQMIGKLIKNHYLIELSHFNNRTFSEFVSFCLAQQIEFMFSAKNLEELYQEYFHKI